MLEGSYGAGGVALLAKIAVELERALARRALFGEAGQATARVLAAGEGWSVDDVICTSGPHDRPFEEQHVQVSIALVTAGSFQYRAAAGRDLLTPGALLLGNPGQTFECSHEHGAGDRCLAFRFHTGYFERLLADVPSPRARPLFGLPRLPPLRAFSTVAARAAAGLLSPADVAWEELALQLATRTLELAGRGRAAVDAPASALARVTRAVRAIERQPDAELTLQALAREARLSPYHFLRTFERLTGVTPHQYVRRARLRAVATRLALEPRRVLDIALEAGFGDISNFNRAFRAEFGTTPRAFRLRAR